jgi:hypothetical protein
MNSSDDREERDMHDGHGDYEHVGLTKAQARIGVLVIGGILLFAVISGMFLY